MRSNLIVTVDGVPLEPETSRELWQRFSAYMEEHKGDLGGFAKAEGYASAHPKSEGGKAVLALSRTEPQAVYGHHPPDPPRPNKRKRR